MEDVKAIKIENKVLRVNLDGKWSSSDFSKMFDILINIAISIVF